MKRSIHILLCSLIVLACNSSTQQGEPDFGNEFPEPGYAPLPLSEKYKTYIELIDSITEKNLQKYNNGAFLIAKNGEIIFEKYTGTQIPRKASDSIDQHTPFHIASVSKTFTAMAVLQLQEHGKLHIHDLITKYIPDFPSESATIESLLNHRSGLPTYDHFMENLGWHKGTFVYNNDIINFIIEHAKDIPIRKANTGFAYSNTNYALLASIIEKVSGVSYPVYLREHIFKPLEMHDSFVFQPEDSARYQPSFYYNGRPYRFDYLDYVYGDKNIYSTVRDLLKWDRALSNGFLSDSSLALAFQPYSFEKPGTLNYGLGWRMKDFPNKKRIIYHNGWWHGNRSALYRLSDEDVTLIALTNNDYKGVYEIKNLADLFGPYYQGGIFAVEGDD